MPLVYPHRYRISAELSAMAHSVVTSTKNPASELASTLEDFSERVAAMEDALELLAELANRAAIPYDSRGVCVLPVRDMYLADGRVTAQSRTEPFAVSPAWLQSIRATLLADHRPNPQAPGDISTAICARCLNGAPAAPSKGRGKREP
jgi:hypothetical protein